MAILLVRKLSNQRLILLIVFVIIVEIFGIPLLLRFKMRLESAIWVFNNNMLFLNVACYINSVAFCKSSAFSRATRFSSTFLIDCWFKSTFTVLMFIFYLLFFYLLSFSILIESVYKFRCWDLLITSLSILLCFQIKLRFHKFLVFLSPFWVFIESISYSLIQLRIMHWFIHNYLSRSRINQWRLLDLLDLLDLLFHCLHLSSFFVQLWDHLQSILNWRCAGVHLLYNQVMSFGL